MNKETSDLALRVMNLQQALLSILGKDKRDPVEELADIKEFIKAILYFDSTQNPGEIYVKDLHPESLERFKTNMEAANARVHSQMQ